ncbi:uncharacterized protein B0I36DRAFT_367689 [Microdochium trichocladiopsis]|uniref:Uncharacterized protein n=1 Tax=Microdochium trichocladiopsis TaxID=1682393 RepID=A0A9P8XWK3_9PEZI|nr:uncharacterized protein B0I36DRAFT_367689 [Microdochium trichocladiopsis]KAH7021262.1 hypothetical protein B0I36DRAFT_367689 [Microdochium trichocladiopsis]
MLARDTDMVVMGRGAYDTTGVPKPPPRPSPNHTRRRVGLDLATHDLLARGPMYQHYCPEDLFGTAADHPLGG